MIFPLALAPFEEYMLADDRPAYPMTFFLRLRLAGRFGLETFPQALRTAVSRHPLLSALVRQVGRRRPEWIRGQPCRSARVSNASAGRKRAAPCRAHRSAEGARSAVVALGGRADDAHGRTVPSCLL